MINNSEFADRLKIIMEFYQLTASSFADKISVQRSSISHLLSGRNKPSLDFVLKVIKQFDDVELYWLLNGKGKFPAMASPTSASADSNQTAVPKEEVAQKYLEPSFLSNNAKTIERIVIFYADATFKEYLQESTKTKSPKK